MLPDPAPVVRFITGDKLLCSATGPFPVYVALVRDSTVLANTTNTVAIILHKAGSYICVASNKYGTDQRSISVIFAGESVYQGLPGATIV